MNLLEYVPAPYLPLVSWLLVLSVIAALFTYVWPLVVTVFAAIPSYFFPRLDWKTFFTSSIGHGLLAYVLAHGVLLSSAGAADWHWWIFAAAAVVLLSCMAVHLYEIQIDRDRQPAGHPKAWLLTGIVLLILWLAIFFAIVYDGVPADSITIRLFEGIAWVFSLPLTTFAAALLGVVVLMPLLIQGLFAVPGIFESLFRKRS